MSSGAKYPDSGHPLDDAAILRTAVNFTTAQRAFTADSILSQPFEHFAFPIRAYFAVNAFMAEMTSYEDVLGWMLVLEKWQPGQFQRSLVRLLDQTQVNDKSEAHAEELLNSLDPEGLRHLLHIPDDSQFESDGLPDQVRVRVNDAIPANLSGLKRLLAYRRRDDRAFVRAFNKLKHLILAVPGIANGKPAVVVPKFYDFDDKAKTVKLQTVSLGCSPDDIRLLASRAVIAQAVLNSLLGLILWVRFGEPYVSPPWTVRSLELPGWVEDEPERDY